MELASKFLGDRIFRLAHQWPHRLLLTLILTSLAYTSLAVFSNLWANGPSEAPETSELRRSCRFTSAPIDSACLNRSGAITVRGVRVFASDGVTFPSELRVYEIRLDGLPRSKNFAITRRGAYIGSDSSSFELFQGETRFQPARWPTVGFSHEIKLDTDNKGVIIPQEIFGRFSGEPDLWLGAYWTADWAFETSRITSSVPNQRKLIFTPLRDPQSIRSIFPFYIFNALEALRRPGDYMFNEARRTVYAAAINDSDLFEVGVDRTLLEINGAHNLHLKGLKLEKGLGTALIIRNSENVTIEDCEISHMGRAGIVVDGGKNVVISRCRISDIGETAVELKGGDRETLTPSGHILRDSEIKSFGLDARVYRPGVMISGVGITVANNLIEDGLHSAIIIQGNNHLLSGNEITNVVKEADDAGAIYSGRDWTERGNVIKGNWFHDIGMPDAPEASLALGRKLVAGVYLDDQESGYKIEGNVFDRISRPVFIHGGRDNIIKDNAFLRCGESAIFLARRGEGMTGGTLQRRLEAMPYDRGIWATNYPELAKLRDDHPADPLHNFESNNITAECPIFAHTPSAPADFWPDIGKTTRIISDIKSKNETTLEVLTTNSLGCERYPVLCRRH